MLMLGACSQREGLRATLTLGGMNCYAMQLTLMRVAISNAVASASANCVGQRPDDLLTFDWQAAPSILPGSFWYPDGS